MSHEDASTIVIDPEIKGGTPVFAGTRVPVYTLFRYLEHGTLDDYLDEFQTVRRDQAVRVLALAERALLQRSAGGLTGGCNSEGRGIRP